MGKAGATLASLVSDEIDWIQLAQQVNDAESTAAVKKLVELSDKVREIRNFSAELSAGGNTQSDGTSNGSPGVARLPVVPASFWTCLE